MGFAHQKRTLNKFKTRKHRSHLIKIKKNKNHRWYRAHRDINLLTNCQKTNILLQLFTVIIRTIIKIRNTKELCSRGINVIEHLPYMDMPDFQDPKNIAQRMMVLLALFQLHVKAPLNIVINWIDSNGLKTYMTEEEKELLKSDYENLPEQSQINIYWFIEAIWAFAWIGGLHNKLSFNKGVENTLASMLPNIAKDEPAESFIEEFKLRNKYEIFSMLDKFYRAHWFARNNNLTGISSDKVNLDLIMERRKALEFTCYSQIDWDEISLDT